jgi:hypothetical protein
MGSLIPKKIQRGRGNKLVISLEIARLFFREVRVNFINSPFVSLRNSSITLLPESASIRIKLADSTRMTYTNFRLLEIEKAVSTE